MRSGVPALLLLPWAATAGEEVAVERDSDHYLVRSPADQGNFLFRIPAFFERVEPVEAPWAVAFRTSREGAGTAAVLLRRSELAEAEARVDLGALARARAGGFAADLLEPGPPEVSGEGARRLVALRSVRAGAPLGRRVLLVRGGARLYALFLDEAPPDSPFAGALRAVAEGFTLLEVKGKEGGPGPTAAELAERRIEQDFYRLTLLKPAGFLEEAVDASVDSGIVAAFRRRSDAGDQCVIRVRAWLGARRPPGSTRWRGPPSTASPAPCTSRRRPRRRPPAPSRVPSRPTASRCPGSCLGPGRSSMRRCSWRSTATAGSTRRR